MHLDHYGEYAVLLAAPLANDWPSSRDGVVTRTRDFGMTAEFPEAVDDHQRVRNVIDDWLTVVDVTDPYDRARFLNRYMASVAAFPRLTDHDDEGWHLHYRADDATSLPRVLLAVISVGTALHLTTRGGAPPRAMRSRQEPRRPVSGRRRRCHPKRTPAVLIRPLREPRGRPKTPRANRISAALGEVESASW